MKRIKILLFCCMLSFGAFFGPAGAQSENPERKILPEKNINIHQIIRIHYSGAVIPEALKVKPGSTVVWINESNSQVEIQFTGKQVTLACKSPVHFALDEEGSFISNRIPNGSVASMCFIEQGEFNFVARKALTASTDRLGDRERLTEFKGKVIVKAE